MSAACYWCDQPTAETVLMSFVGESSVEPMCTPCQIENGYKVRPWFPHLDFTGDPMRKGNFREPFPMEEERPA